MRKYTCFAFDIDGTLIDTEKTGVLSLQKTIHDLMGQDLPYDEVYKFFGIPSRNVAPKLGYPETDLFAHTWEQNFIDMRHYMSPFDGVIDALKALKAQGVIMGVVTSRSGFELDNDPFFAMMSEHFDFVISAEDTTRHKPEPEPMLAFIGKASAIAGREIKASECLYLGDTMHDFGCADGAGADFALADWKKKGWQNIPGKYIFSSSEEIVAFAGL